MKRIGPCALLGAAIFCGFGTALADVPDYFVEYVESDGSTFVNTEVRGKSSVKMAADLMYLQLDKNNGFIGSRYKSNTSNRFFPFHCNDEYASLGYQQFRQSGMALSAGVKYHVDSTLEPGNQKLFVDGEAASTVQVDGAVDSERDMYLFGVNIGGTAEYTQKARCYGLKLWQTDASGNYQLVRDFRPSVKDNVAGLYDRVSERMFYGRDAANSSLPRNLTPGPALIKDFGTRKVKGSPNCYVEYITSDGVQVLDTGVPARAGAHAWADMQWRDAKTPGGIGRSLLAAQPEDDDKSVFLIHGSYTDNNPADGGKVHRVRFVCGGSGVWPLQDDGKSWIYEFNTDSANNPRITVDGDFTDPSAITYSLDGGQIWNGAGENVDSGLSLALFGANFGDGVCKYVSKVRLYRLKLWLDGNLVRDYRPCLKGDEAGLYDAVNDEVIFPAKPFPMSGVGATVDESGSTLQFVDYVENDGHEAAYVNTEVIGRSGTKIETDLLYPEIRDSAFIGSRVSTSGKDRTRIFPFYCNTSKASLGYADFRQGSTELLANVKYHVESTLEPGNQKLYVNGELVPTVQVDDDVNSGYNMYLFGANIGGTSSKAYYPAKARCYGLKIWQTDVDGNYQLVRDFRPCVKFVKDGTNTGGLYDTVSKRIFVSHSSSHPLVVGNDAAKGRPDKYVEYIQSTGLQMLDTGVPARTGVKAEGDFMFWAEIESQQCYLGALGDQRMYMIHQANKKAWASFGNTDSGTANPGYLKWPDGTDAQYAKGVTNHFVCDWSDLAHATLDVNGKRIMDAAKSPAPSIGETFGLFACRDGAYGRYPSLARCYGLKFWLDGELVRDFVPCVKNGRGALFDRVTRRIYFPMGADITEANVGPALPPPGFQILVR